MHLFKISEIGKKLHLQYVEYFILFYWSLIKKMSLSE